MTTKKKIHRNAWGCAFLLDVFLNFFVVAICLGWSTGDDKKITKTKRPTNEWLRKINEDNLFAAYVLLFVLKDVFNAVNDKKSIV